MKVFIYGKNSDDKGAQLEALTAAILKNMGYTISCNEISSGGSELDVVATKKEPIGGDICLICECKARNDLVSMNDWLKFIGKVYLEQRKNQMTYGLMIALSGANGYVLGSYKDLKTENFISLITNEELLGQIQSVHPMMSRTQVEDIIGQYSRKDIVDTSIIYYENCFYWYLRFPNGEYTILKDDLSNVEDEKLTGFRDMIVTQTDSRLFVDIKEEFEAIQRRSFIRSLILSHNLDEGHTIQETVDWINVIRDGFNVTYTEVEEGIKAIPFLKCADNKPVTVIEERDIDFIEFYRFILQGTVTTKIMSTRYYKEHINESLLCRIKEIQCNIQVPEENVEECLFLMKHSPSALAYAINEDKAITRYRSPKGTFSPNIDKAHTEWFLDNIMRGFIADYNNQSLHEYFLDVEKIASIEMHTNLKVFKDGEEPREIHHFKAECLGHLGEEYNNQAILMVKIPE